VTDEILSPPTYSQMPTKRADRLNGEIRLLYSHNGTVVAIHFGN